MESKLTAHALLFFAATLAQAQTFAGTPPDDDEGRDGGGPPPFEVKMESSYTLGGDTEFGGRQFGESDAFNASLALSAFWPLSEKWSIPFELQSQHLSLGALAGVPLPHTINTLEFGLGLGYRPNDRWMFMFRVNPAFYKFEDVGGNDIGFSGGLMAEWQHSPSFKWMFGVMWQPNNTMPVIPLVGFEWQINDQWELLMTFPKPRLVYSVTDRLKLHAGMDLILGTTFRSSDTLGTSIGLPQYNDALGSYSEVRLALGAGYQVTKSLSLEAEGGYAISRDIEYQDIDNKVTFDPTPYVRIGLRFEF